MITNGPPVTISIAVIHVEFSGLELYGGVRNIYADLYWSFKYSVNNSKFVSMPKLTLQKLYCIKFLCFCR